MVIMKRFVSTVFFFIEINSHLLTLCISCRSDGQKLSSYQLNPSWVLGLLNSLNHSVL